MMLPLLPRNQVVHSGQHGGFALNEHGKTLSEKASTSANESDARQQSVDYSRDICTVRDSVRMLEG
jgi:hypothetical protein